MTKYGTTAHVKQPLSHCKASGVFSFFISQIAKAMLPGNAPAVISTKTGSEIST